MRTAKVLPLILMLIVPAMLMGSVCDSSDGAPPNGVSVGVFNDGTADPIQMDAGTEYTFDIIVNNETSGTILVRVAGYEFAGISRVEVKIPEEPIEIDTGMHSFSIPVTIDKYAGTHSGKIMFDLVIAAAGAAGDIVLGDVRVEFSVDIYSTLSAGNSYNKIMGIWPSFSAEPIYTLLVSLVLWIIFAAILSCMVLPFIISVIMKEVDKRKDIGKATWRPFFILIMLYALASCARIYGIGEEPTAIIDNFVNIAYILVGALVAWRIYGAVLDYFFSRAPRASSKNDIDHSLRPLLELLGKLAIAVTAFASILAAMGFNLVMIATGAGVLGLAITLGAQNTLSQFFSGITLLTTRPFRKGDLIKIDGGNVLLVKKVGLMTSEFDEWDTNSVFVIPNNKVASAAITNITRKTKVHPISVYVGISYDSDVKLAKDLMTEAAMEHPHVVKDKGKLPSARLNSFEDSYMNMRLIVSVDDYRDHGTISGQLRESIVSKFKEHGLTVAIPQMDVNLTDGRDAEGGPKGAGGTAEGQ